MKKTCKKICYEWHDIAKKINTQHNCKYFRIDGGVPRCELYGKLKKQVVGEIFYLGRNK